MSPQLLLSRGCRSVAVAIVPLGPTHKHVEDNASDEADAGALVIDRRQGRVLLCHWRVGRSSGCSRSSPCCSGCSRSSPSRSSPRGACFSRSSPSRSSRSSPSRSCFLKRGAGCWPRCRGKPCVSPPSLRNGAYLCASGGRHIMEAGLRSRRNFASCAYLAGAPVRWRSPVP